MHSSIVYSWTPCHCLRPIYATTHHPCRHGFSLLCLGLKNHPDRMPQVDEVWAGLIAEYGPRGREWSTSFPFSGQAKSTSESLESGYTATPTRRDRSGPIRVKSSKAVLLMLLQYHVHAGLWIYVKRVPSHIFSELVTTCILIILVNEQIVGIFHATWLTEGFSPTLIPQLFFEHFRALLSAQIRWLDCISGSFFTVGWMDSCLENKCQLCTCDGCVSVAIRVRC